LLTLGTKAKRRFQYNRKSKNILFLPAVLASVALTLIDDAVFVLAAGVGQVFPDSTLEEALAALAAVHPVVLSTRPVSADRAQVLGSAQRMVWRIRTRALAVARSGLAALAHESLRHSCKKNTRNTINLQLLLTLNYDPAFINNNRNGETLQLTFFKHGDKTLNNYHNMVLLFCSSRPG